jgi:GTP cyclohydrolase II
MRNPITELDLARRTQVNDQQHNDASAPSERDDELRVEIFATARLPTKFGRFDIVAFENNRDDKDHIAILKGEISGARDVRTRIHSECLTGDVFGSLKCDCGPQLEHALRKIEEEGEGLILYMRQEGRGIGLANKIKAYSLQDQGLDTVEANLHLGFDDDIRTYDIAAEMLRLLEVESIELLTNNPKKVQGLREAGIDVSRRVPLKVPPNPFNIRYLKTKRDKSGHLMGPIKLTSEN